MPDEKLPQPPCDCAGKLNTLRDRLKKLADEVRELSEKVGNIRG